MQFRQLKFLIKSDLHRYYGETTGLILLRCLLSNAFPGYKYTFWMRICCYLRQGGICRLLFLVPARIMLSHYEYKFGISIPYGTKIDSGLYIGHFGGIVVTGEAVIGKNCNISHGVTIGRANRGAKKGYPVLKDNIYIGPGAKIVGKVVIGSNAAIGANCVVTSDIPENAVVVGIPGKVISYSGSDGYVNRTDY